MVCSVLTIHGRMDEETAEVEPKNELGCYCTCLSDNVSSETVEIPERKQLIFTTVARTENYLRERRIPELVRFLFTKIIAEGSDKPVVYLENLLDDCMLFRAGHGPPPVLYEKRHLEAVIKSFDPGNRGWMSAGQIHRMYTTLGLTLDDAEETYEERYSCDVVLEKVQQVQDAELFDLLSAGMAVSTAVGTLHNDHMAAKTTIL